MVLLQLATRGFRNLKEQALVFNEGLQVFVGANAQGKTNLLEAIFCLLTGRSFRSVDDAALVQSETPSYFLEGLVARKSDRVKIRLTYAREGGRKTAEVNSLPLRRVADLWSEVKAVAFSPSDSQIVKGPPLLRRRFINSFLCQMSARYRLSLLRFGQALRQRNFLLKGEQRGGKGEGRAAWEEAYIDSGQALIEMRAAQILSLERAARSFFSRLGMGENSLSLRYSPSSRDLREDLQKNQSKEILAGTSLYGPHLDDIEIHLEGKEARTYASEGEARVAALAVRLGEWEALFQGTGEPPLLLLDDALSELDEKRQIALLAQLVQCPQVFLSAVSAKFFPDPYSKEARFYYVQAGEAKKKTLDAPC